MKFICKQQTLSKALNTVSKAISARTTLPILKGILLRVEDGRLHLAASDLDLSIEKTIEAERTEKGAVVVTAKLFGDIIRKLPNEDILIEEEEGNVILIKSSTSEFKIMGISPEEYPSLNENTENFEKIILDKDIYKDMIRKSAFAASIDESKGVIVGILTEIKEDSLNMVALDGFRMAVIREGMKNSSEKRIVISGKIMNELGKIISEEDGEGNLELLVSAKKAVAYLDDTKITMRVMEGEFIKYKDIIPKEHKCRVVVSRSALLDGIERASLFSKEGKNNLIKLSIGGGFMVITSRSEEGNVREEVMIEKEGDDLDIGFNSKYVIDVLKVIDDEMISMEFNTSINPCLVKPVSGNGYEFLILPVRINRSL